jgi:hypothetical protein
MACCTVADVTYREAAAAAAHTCAAAVVCFVVCALVCVACWACDLTCTPPLHTHTWMGHPPTLIIVTVVVITTHRALYGGSDPAANKAALVSALLLRCYNSDETRRPSAVLTARYLTRCDPCTALSSLCHVMLLLCAIKGGIFERVVIFLMFWGARAAVGDVLVLQSWCPS